MRTTQNMTPSGDDALRLRPPGPADRGGRKRRRHGARIRLARRHAARGGGRRRHREPEALVRARRPSRPPDQDDGRRKGAWSGTRSTGRSARSHAITGTASNDLRFPGSISRSRPGCTTTGTATTTRRSGATRSPIRSASSTGRACMRMRSLRRRRTSIRKEKQHRCRRRWRAGRKRRLPTFPAAVRRRGCDGGRRVAVLQENVWVGSRWWRWR